MNTKGRLNSKGNVKSGSNRTCMNEVCMAGSGGVNADMEDGCNSVNTELMNSAVEMCS